MTRLLLSLYAAGLWFAVPASAAPAKPDANAKPSGFKPSRDDVVRLQIYLDEQNFGPGRIDGGYGGFTKKSWMRYQESRGETPREEFDAARFTSVDPTYTTYTVAAEDLAAIGTIPGKLAEQAKTKALPYTSLSELIGERYHVGVDFLKKLNAPKNVDQLKEGEQVKVPNIVPPFNLAQVFALRQYTGEREKIIKANAEAAKKDRAEQPKPDASPAPAANATAAAIPEAIPGPTVALSAAPPPPEAVPSPSPTAAPLPDTSPSPAPEEARKAPDNRPVLTAVPANSSRLVFHVNTKESYLEVRDGERLVACFPITPGSASIPTPKGNWKVVAKTLLPQFRWDKSVLLYGKRSGTAYELPPGPNNPVGITWIALDRPGIGMHGTSDPDSIGRSASHGCIRLSNWDAFKVYGMVARGTQVIIE